MSELELDAAAMRDLVARAMERLVPYVESLPRQATIDLDGAAELARSLREPLPEAGAAVDELLSLLFDRAVPKGFNPAGPGYLAYIPGGGLFHSAVADLIAGTVNRYVGVWQAAPGLAELEANVGRWFCALMGLPPSSQGVLTTGGSLANLVALVTARHERLGEDFQDGCVYVSDQSHHSVAKAARLAGLPARAVRVVETDARFRMRPDRLRERMAADRSSGLAPFLVVAAAGTTNTGAVDDLQAIADVAAGAGAWLHVDAAYGGFFALTERGRRALSGIDRADSIVLDPHKGLFLPYGTGAVLVRDGGALRRAHEVSADYMPDYQEAEFVDFCAVSPELSRSFRGLRVWLPVKMHGAAAFRAALDEKLDLARRAADALRATDGIEIVAEPQLSLFAFRFAAPDRSPEQLDALNRQLLDGVNARGRVHVTGTRVRGAFVLRLCVLSFRTHVERIDAAVEDVREVLRHVRAGQPPA